MAFTKTMCSSFSSKIMSTSSEQNLSTHLKGGWKWSTVQQTVPGEFASLVDWTAISQSALSSSSIGQKLTNQFSAQSFFFFFKLLNHGIEIGLLEHVQQKWILQWKIIHWMKLPKKSLNIQCYIYWYMYCGIAPYRIKLMWTRIPSNLHRDHLPSQAIRTFSFMFCCILFYMNRFWIFLFAFYSPCQQLY